MFNKFSIISIQVSLLLLGTTSNLIQPEYSMKIFNTENLILSLGDIDDDTNNDLEIVKENPDPQLEKKLYDFHKYINLAEKTERPKQKEFMPRNEFYKALSNFQMTYPDSPYQIAVNEKQLNMLERRNAKKKKKLKRNTEFGIAAVKIKKQIPNPQDKKTIEDYDYMEHEYLDYLGKSQKNNNAFKYSDEGKPEEGVKDVMNKIIDLKTPKNCTNVQGIGVQRIECIIKNFKDNVYDQKQMLYGILGIILIWLCIYLAIALPLWCAKGWCCCCCRCAFCFPTRTVKEIQKYIAQNPPGVYKNSTGNEEHYKPTQKETELYEKIRRSIAEF